ncbi:hypothetical protein [Aeromonas phage AS-zj]|uniref:Uncharacterized protein n=1 Tax=Aeromonas phage AS-zj TaxID=2024208 RepID=A0A223LFP2_9CAUD|nr:goF mRNA metabolism modulator [Aeromonas phage AS-zj]ASU00309.1 hypothetical protein [Aeromonas phage AS-zj]
MTDIMRIRFLSEKDKEHFVSRSVHANTHIAKHMGMDWNRVSFNGRRWSLVDENNKDVVIGGIDVATTILPLEYQFFEWDILPVENKPSIKSLWDIAQQKKAEYDDAMVEYNKAVMEKLDESAI